MPSQPWAPIKSRSACSRACTASWTFTVRKRDGFAPAAAGGFLPPLRLRVRVGACAVGCGAACCGCCAAGTACAGTPLTGCAPDKGLGALGNAITAGLSSNGMRCNVDRQDNEYAGQRPTKNGVMSKRATSEELGEMWVRHGGLGRRQTVYWSYHPERIGVNLHRMPPLRLHTCATCACDVAMT